MKRFILAASLAIAATPALADAPYIQCKPIAVHSGVVAYHFVCNDGTAYAIPNGTNHSTNDAALVDTAQALSQFIEFQFEPGGGYISCNPAICGGADKAPITRNFNRGYGP